MACISHARCTNLRRHGVLHAAAFFAFVRRQDVADNSLLSRFRVFIALSDTTSPLALEKAINASAVAIEVPQKYHSQASKAGWRTPRSGMMFGKRQILTISADTVDDETRKRLFIVPSMAQANQIGTARVIIPQMSFAQTAVAFFQVLYSSVELFGNHWSSIRQQGISSPYVLVIAYALMSLINLLVNIIIPSYPYVSVLDPIYRKINRQRN